MQQRFQQSQLQVVQAYPRPQSALSLRVQRPGIAREAGQAPKKTEHAEEMQIPASPEAVRPDEAAGKSAALEQLKTLVPGSPGIPSLGGHGSVIGGIYNNLFSHKGLARVDGQPLVEETQTDLPDGSIGR